MKAEEILEDIDRQLESLNAKMAQHLRYHKKGNPAVKSSIPEHSPLDAMALLDMPDHLRKTALIVLREGSMTAQKVADISKRVRAVESAYLNQLVLMGYMKKERKGRKAFFFVPNRPEDT